MVHVIKDVRSDDLTLPSGLKIYNQWNNPLVALYIEFLTCSCEVPGVATAKEKPSDCSSLG